MTHIPPNEECIGGCRYVLPVSNSVYFGHVYASYSVRDPSVTMLHLIICPLTIIILALFKFYFSVQICQAVAKIHKEKRIPKAP